MKTQKTPLFQGIGETALAEMFTCGGARCKTYAKGEVLLRAGCITHEVGIVQAGGVNIENIDLWGNRSILSHVPAGQVFAETYLAIPSWSCLTSVLRMVCIKSNTMIPNTSPNF